MAPSKKSTRKDAHEEEDPFINNEDEDIEAEGEDGPPVINPYEVLELEKDATADDVKKAYRKMALKHHPDKVTAENKEAANQHFQEIAFAYAILSDERRRERYDRTGSTSEVLEDEEDFNWLSFYREQFADALTTENITTFSQKYKGSDEERQDLLKAYTEHEGNLGHIYQTVMLSDVLEDDDRFRQILDEEIANGTIESYPLYERENNDAARQKAKDAARKQREDFDKRQAAEEKKQAAGTSKAARKPAKAKKSASNSMDDLAALIQSRQKARHGPSFFDQLESKYAPKQGRKRASPMDEPSEEAFAAMAARKKSKPTTETKRTAKKPQAKKSKAVDMDEESEDISESEEVSEEEEYVAPRKTKGRNLRRGRARA
jgi:DnaJ homolog subfamily C member 9